MSEIPSPVASPKVFFGHVLFPSVSDGTSQHVCDPSDKLQKATKKPQRLAMEKPSKLLPSGLETSLSTKQELGLLGKTHCPSVQQKQLMLTGNFRDSAQIICQLSAINRRFPHAPPPCQACGNTSTSEPEVPTRWYCISNGTTRFQIHPSHPRTKDRHCCQRRARFLKGRRSGDKST